MTDADAIRRTIISWLVQHGEPVRGACNDPTWGIYEHVGMQMHLSGRRELLETRRKRKTGLGPAGEILERWMEDVPESGCELMFERITWSDATWPVWNSYDESAFYERGVDIQVFCKCGRISNAVWRYEGTWGDLLRDITEE